MSKKNKRLTKNRRKAINRRLTKNRRKAKNRRLTRNRKKVNTYKRNKKTYKRTNKRYIKSNYPQYGGNPLTSTEEAVNDPRVENYLNDVKKSTETLHRGVENDFRYLYSKDGEYKWVSDDFPKCMICLGSFSFLNRRHHCRNCGGIFCSTHSDKRKEFKNGLGTHKVCDFCFNLNFKRILIIGRTLKEHQALDKKASRLIANLGLNGQDIVIEFLDRDNGDERSIIFTDASNKTIILTPINSKWENFFVPQNQKDYDYIINDSYTVGGINKLNVNLNQFLKVGGQCYIQDIIDGEAEADLEGTYYEYYKIPKGNNAGNPDVNYFIIIQNSPWGRQYLPNYLEKPSEPVLLQKLIISKDFEKTAPSGVTISAEAVLNIYGAPFKTFLDDFQSNTGLGGLEREKHRIRGTNAFPLHHNNHTQPQSHFPFYYVWKK